MKKIKYFCGIAILICIVSVFTSCRDDSNTSLPCRKEAGLASPSRNELRHIGAGRTDHHRFGRQGENRARGRGCRGNGEHHSSRREQRHEARHPLYVLPLAARLSAGRSAPRNSAGINTQDLMVATRLLVAI